ncbi:MAG: hypothetical protein QNJ57_02535 [Flavobacteriaceae bacterium]|nr:hypothetical protein [Flavobacteriaceae bacterium]
MNKYLVCYVIVIIALFSCGKRANGDDSIARVYDAYLYHEDLKNALPAQLSETDSLLLAKNFINNWAKQQLLLKKAEINVGDSLAEIDVLVDQYRRDLLISKYKEAVIEQYLDTLATSEDIDVFYEENKEIFKLNEELVKLKYIHFSSQVNNHDEFEELFRSSKKENLDSLKSKELQLISYNLNDSIWIRLDDIMKKITSFTAKDRQRILKRTAFFEKKDSLEVYLVAVKQVLKRGQTAPKSYVIPTVKQMILHKRKLELLKKIEETLIEDAITNKEYEIYEGK